MKTLLVPKFKEVWPVGAKHHDYQFTGYKPVKIKNKPDTKDYNKVVSELPGFAQGYCDELYTIGQTEKPIEITRFYDSRQASAKKLKNYFIITPSYL